MTQDVAPQWFPTSQASAYAASLQLNATTDLIWRINCNTTVLANDGHTIVPHFMVVDNILNGANSTVTFGPFTFVVAAYQRQTFTLPDNTQLIQFTLTSGLTIVTFSEMDVKADSQNSLLIQQTAVKTLIYSFVPYNSNQAQLASDLNTTTNFKPVAADIQYTLLPISTTPVSNGWLQFIKNNGTKKTSIVPNGGDTINGVFTAGAPIVLNPGDTGILQSDGTQWYYQGKITSIFPDAAFTLASNTTVFTHGLGKAPDILRIRFTCSIANIGYAVGDIMEMTWMQASAGATFNGGIIPVVTSTTVTLIIGQNIIVWNKGSPGTIGVITAADWTISMVAEAIY